MLVSSLEKEYALGCNVLEDIVTARAWFFNSGDVEDVTIVSWDCVTWNNK